MRTVLAFVEAPDHVCCRYRIAAFSEALAQRGLTLDVEPLRRGILARTAQLMAARRACIVLLQRKLLPWAQARLLRWSARNLVYDFDDAVFQRDSFSPKGPESRQRRARFHAIVSAADAVLAGNDYLARQAAVHRDPARVHVIPTCVAPDIYPLAEQLRSGPQVQLAWIGSQSTLQGIERARPWLAAVGRRLPGITLRLICDRAVEIPGIQVLARPWSSATEARELAAADIGISWLPDDSFTKGKCGLKVLQYMAVGLPVVANPVGVHPEMVVLGETGCLASTPDEWAEAVARLADDPDLRRRMGRAGRRRVEELYSVARWAPSFADLIDRLAGPLPLHSARSA